MTSDKKRLFPRYDFSDSDTSEGEQILEATPISIAVKSPEKLLAPGTSNMSRSRKKRKPTVAYRSGCKKVWSEDDELCILKGIADYRKETGVEYNSDSGAFFGYLKDRMESIFSKDQLMCKVRKLKSRFRDSSAKKPCFTKSHDSVIFKLSMAIWGKDKGVCVDGNMTKSNNVQASVQQEAGIDGEPKDDDGSPKSDSYEVKFPYEKLGKNTENEDGGKESEEEDEALPNGLPVNDDGSAKSDSSDKLPSDNVDKHVDNETGENENEEDGADSADAEDELCALEDALEATMFKHSSKCAEKMMLQKLRTLNGNKRKELSDEWNSLLAQEMQLKSKKLSFGGKVATAALDA